MTDVPAPLEPRSPRNRWRLGLVIGWLAGGCLFTLFPGLQHRLGLADIGMWFADSYAVLAAADTARAGLDPTEPMAGDPFQRPHVYSDWWLALGRLGLGRADNFLVGGLWVAGFAAAVLLLLRPRDAAGTFLCAALVLSPPVMLGVNRANNDLPVFVGLAGIAVLVSRRQLGWQLAGAALVALVTGLKYYPAVAAAAFLVVRPVQRMAGLLALAAAAAALALADVWPAIARGMFHVPNLIHASGGGLLWRNVGWEGNGIAALNAALLLAAGWWLWRSGRAGPAAELRSGGWPAAAFVAGAAVSVACFAAGVSYSYRLIHLLLVVPWLLGTGRDRPARGAWTVLGLVAVVLWLDGLIALAGNLLFAPMPADVARAIIFHSRWLTQPPAWILMAWLTACLLGVLAEAIRELRPPAGHVPQG